jgi:hypothetical protein
MSRGFSRSLMRSATDFGTNFELIAIHSPYEIRAALFL